MAVMNAYPSRAQQEHAVRRVTELLREAGHSDDPQQLVTTMRTEADRQHAVAVAVGNESPLAHRIGAALRKAGKIDAPTLLHRTAQILRTDKPERWLDRWGDGSVRGVDIAKVLKTAWEQLDGERKVDAEDLPGADTLAAVLNNMPRNESRVGVSYTFYEWMMNPYNTTEETIERVEMAVHATCPRGRERRERAGFMLALQEAKLREARSLLREQIQGEPVGHDATKVSEAATRLLAELDKLQGRIGDSKPQHATEDAA